MIINNKEEKQNIEEVIMKPRKTYDELMSNQKQLSGYLMYIRQKKKPANIIIQYPNFNEKMPLREIRNQKLMQAKVGEYVQLYLSMLKEVSALDNYATKKIFKSILHFLEEFPTMNFLYEVISAFGKVQKKLSMNQFNIMSEATDDMIPLFQKIIERIQFLKKESQSKKLMELGHRIQHLQDMIKHSKSNFSVSDPQIAKIFKKFQPERIERYIAMEDNITKAQKRFGSFSQNFVKNREVFSNLNRVYEDIKKHEKQDTV